MNELTVIDNQTIQNKIYTIRDVQVMVDRDLALLYGVETRALKQAVKRNIERFPEDFMFELIDSEIDYMVSQSVIPSKKHLGGAKPFPSFPTSSLGMQIDESVSNASMHSRKQRACERERLFV